MPHSKNPGINPESGQSQGMIGESEPFAQRILCASTHVCGLWSELSSNHLPPSPWGSQHTWSPPPPFPFPFFLDQWRLFWRSLPGVSSYITSTHTCVIKYESSLVIYQLYNSLVVNTRSTNPVVSDSLVFPHWPTLMEWMLDTWPFKTTEYMFKTWAILSVVSGLPTANNCCFSWSTTQRKRREKEKEGEKRKCWVHVASTETQIICSIANLY